MMTFEESLAFIHSIERFGSKPGLRRVQMLLERMGNPQRQLRFVHVAGTDGKGSVCTMLESILRRAGYRTGLYISPFVVDFRERIQLCGEMIEPDELARSVTTVKAHWDLLDAAGETPTEFEVVVAVAIDFFARMDCEIVILEVGMGGRLDATNVIDTPLCSVINHLSLDHMQYLGDTIEQIAFEKCGIIKPGGVTVSYPEQDPAALAVIMERCAEEENPLHIGHRAEILETNTAGGRFRYGDQVFYLSLPGAHQVLNAVTAIEAARVLSGRGFPLTDLQIGDGLARAHLPARIETLAHRPLVLLDGGHNPAEAAALADVLSSLPGRRIHAVIGMLADKDVESCLSAILPHCASLTAITPDDARALPAEQLAAIARRHCKDVQVLGGDAGGALAQTLDRCAPEDALLCCGSLYLASSLRPQLLSMLAKTEYKSRPGSMVAGAAFGLGV